MAEMEKLFKILHDVVKYLQVGGFFIFFISLFLESGWLLLGGAVALGLGIYLHPIVKKWEAHMTLKEELFRALIEGRSVRSGLIAAAGKMGVNTEGLELEASNNVETTNLLQPSAQNRAVELSTGGVAENSDMELCTGGVNSVFLIGEIVTEPEVRYLVESGEPIFSYRLATEKLWNDFSGKFSDENEYHQIKQIGEILEYEPPILSKGDQVYINGFMRTRGEVDSDGMKQFTTYIYTYNVIRLMKKEEPQLCRFFE